MPSDLDVLPFSKLLLDYQGVRRMVLNLLAPVDEEEALRIPSGFKNHLHWQLGHLLYTQNSMLNNRCAQPSQIPKTCRDYFGMGTGPAQYDSLIPDWDQLLAWAETLSRDMPAQYAGRMTLSMNKPLTLMNIAMSTGGEAVPFLLAHEAEHLSHIKRLIKALTPED